MVVVGMAVAEMAGLMVVVGMAVAEMGTESGMRNAGAEELTL